MSVTGSPPGFYRLVSPALTTGVKAGSLNDNVTFNTNIPSLDFAIRIRRIIWMNSFSSLAADSAAAANSQYFMQLTENQTKTSILTTDTSFLGENWLHFMANDNVAAGAGAWPYGINMRTVDQFSDAGTPYTVATKLNFVVTQVNNGSATPSASTIFKPFVFIEYTLERLTADLRAYLATRLQIQGS